MPTVVERSLFKIGGGFAVTLPKDWVRRNKLKPGDKVVIMADREITIRPKRENKFILDRV